MIPVTVRIFSRSQHTIQVLTGFHMLREQGFVDLDIEKETREGIPHPHFIEAIVNGKLVAFDTADGYENIDGLEGYLSNPDLVYYFKRSFSGEINKKLPNDCAVKIKPLGLYYYTTYDGTVLGRGGEKGLKRYLKIWMGKDMPMSVEEFENKRFNICNNNPRILFTVRLWNPDTAKTESDRAERHYINDLRLGIIQKLKNKYPQQFFGGVQEDEYSKVVCPDLILPSSITKRRNYIRRMKKCDICISSMGLHASIGNKFAEYIAASRAVVCEKMAYEAPGNLAEGVNYLSFSTVDECVKHVEYLLNHKEKIIEMQKANHDYYLHYLRPDKMILNAINQI